MDSFDFGSYEDKAICDKYAEIQELNKIKKEEPNDLDLKAPNFADILADKIAYNLKFWNDLTK